MFKFARCARLRIKTATRLYATDSERVQLRPYQESCLQSCLDVLAQGSSRIGVSLPTGSGKTTVFISLINRIRPPTTNEQAVRSLIIVNSVELAIQAAQQVLRLFPHLSVEIEQGTKHKATGLADITVATYQTLLRGDRLAKFDASKLKAIIVDEAHHAAAPSYRKILSHFDKSVRHPDVDFRIPELPHVIPIVGFSATFSRHDGIALGSVFQRIVFHRDFLDMIKEQWLCNVKFTSVKAQLNLEDVKINTQNGEFNPTSLAHVVNTDTVNRLVVRTWIDRAGSRLSTLVFCVNLEHLRDLTAEFRATGIDARYVYAGTPAHERRDLIDAFRMGQFPVLLNVAILTEGADIPNIDCVVVAKPTRSRNVFAQMIGRGMRLSPKTAKKDCHIIDFVDSTSRIPGIISIPTLFGLDPDSVIAGENLEDIEARASDSVLEKAGDAFPSRGVSGEIGDPKTVTYIDYENPFALIQDSSGAPHIAKLSTFSWVGCGGDIYVLECLGKGYIRLQAAIVEGEESPHFTAYYVQAAANTEANFFRKSKFNRPRKILTAADLPSAIRGCDTYATEKVCFGKMHLGLRKSAKWRREPATTGQIAILQKRYSGSSGAQNDTTGKFDINTLTKGQAANMITRLKHGAQARYAAKSKQVSKEKKEMDKELKRQARERVVVGMLSADDKDVNFEQAR